MKFTCSVVKQAVVVLALAMLVPGVLYAQGGGGRPPAPTLHVDHPSRAVEISWSTVSLPDSQTRYEVWSWTEQDGWVLIGDVDETIVMHENLVTGVQYWYTYRVVVGGEAGPWSLYADVTIGQASQPATHTPTPHPTPTPVMTATPQAEKTTSFSPPTVTVQLVGQDIRVKWTQVAGATAYRVACWPCGEGGEWHVFNWVEDMWETNLTAQPSTTYWFAVQARNREGSQTEWSEYASITTPATIPTPTPEPLPTVTPTVTPVSSSAYDRWLPGITIAPEIGRERCALIVWEEYTYDYQSEEYRSMIRQIVDSMGGRYYDPYLGQYFGGHQNMRVNPVVNILDAHRSGLCHPDRRQTRHTFLYDWENSVLTSSRLTGHSDNGDLSDWLPELNRCWYVNQAVHVKRKYGLTMDVDEADAAVGVLSGCESVEMVFSHSPTPTPTVVTNDPLRMYDDDRNGRISCQEARNHGIAPVHSVHPAYPHMDPPGQNGVACG